MIIPENLQVTPFQLVVFVCCMIGLEHEGKIPRGEVEKVLNRMEEYHTKVTGMPPGSLFGPLIPEGCCQSNISDKRRNQNEN